MLSGHVQVILVTYNHERFIEECLRGIEIQDWDGALSIDVFDDGSTDRTIELIEQFALRSRHKLKIHPVEKNLGTQSNYIKAFSQVSGEFVAILEGDDFWLTNNHISACVADLTRYPSAAFAFSSIAILELNGEFNLRKYADGKIFSAHDLAKDNFIGNFSCCVFRSDTIARALPRYRDIQGYDWIFNLLAAHGSFFLRSKRSVTVYRIHSGGVWSRKSRLDRIGEVQAAIQLYDKFLGFELRESFALHTRLLNEARYHDTLGAKMRHFLRLCIPPIILFIAKKFRPPRKAVKTLMGKMR